MIKPRILTRVSHIPVEVLVDGMDFPLMQIGNFFVAATEHCQYLINQLWHALGVGRPLPTDFTTLHVQDTLEHYEVVKFTGSQALLSSLLICVRQTSTDSMGDFILLFQELENTLALALHIGCGPPARGEETMRATFFGTNLAIKSIFWGSERVHDVFWTARPHKPHTDDHVLKFPAPILAETLLLVCGLLAPAYVEALQKHYPDALPVAQEPCLFPTAAKNHLSSIFPARMAGPSFKTDTGYTWDAAKPLNISQYRAIVGLLTGLAELSKLASLAPGRDTHAEESTHVLMSHIAELMGHHAAMHSSVWYAQSTRLPDGSNMSSQNLEQRRNATRVFNSLVGIPDHQNSAPRVHLGRELVEGDLTSRAGRHALCICVGSADAEWRPGQCEMIQVTLRKDHDVMVLFDVGYGKSLLYQWASVMSSTCPEIRARTFLVIAPTRTLLSDQAKRLRDLGVSVFELKGNEAGTSGVSARFHSAMTQADGPPKVILATLEMLTIPHFQASLRIYADIWAALVVDEAHIVFSQDSLSSYKFAHLRTALGKRVPLVALSATIPTCMEPAVKEMLCMQQDCKRICIQGEPRLHVKYILEPNLTAGTQDQATIRYASQIMSMGVATTILIACATKPEVAHVASILRGKVSNLENSDIVQLTADTEHRALVSESWISGPARILVITSALAVGINSKTCAGVIVYSSLSILSAIQAFGRAGRAGQEALAVLLYKNGDAEQMNTWLLRPNRLKDDTFDALFPMSVHDFIMGTDCARCRIGKVLGIALEPCSAAGQFCSACEAAGNQRPAQVPVLDMSQPEPRPSAGREAMFTQAMDTSITSNRRRDSFSSLVDTYGQGVLKCVFCKSLTCQSHPQFCDWIHQHVTDIGGTHGNANVCFACFGIGPPTGHVAAQCMIRKAFRANGVVYDAYIRKSMCARCLVDECPRLTHCDDKAVKLLTGLIIASDEVRSTLLHDARTNLELQDLDIGVLEALHAHNNHNASQVKDFLTAMTEPVSGGGTGFMILGAWWDRGGRSLHEKLHKELVEAMALGSE